jgi:hypothetical protein
MTPNRLLAIAALALAGGSSAFAYEIIESRYHVEVAPGKFQDQLVLKCDNGRKVTVPWEAKLYEACGEDLLGRTAKSDNPEEFAQERQKEVMMSRVREQYGNIDEKYVQFESGPAGTSMQLQGPIREILKRYEICRRQTQNSPTCVTERDQAMAALAPADGKPAAQPTARAAAEKPVPEGKPLAEANPAAEPKPTVTKATASKKKKGAAKATSQPEAKPSVKPDAVVADVVENKQAVEDAPTQPGSKPAAQGEPAEAAPMPAAEAPRAKPAPQPAAAAAPEPAPAAAPSNEQKIAEDYAWCMRAKPKFECEQERAKAMSALNKPKAVKPGPKAKAANEAGPVKAVYTPAQ